MTRNIWIFLIFAVGVAGLMIFNVMVLGVGDSKFSKTIQTALGFYFPIWLIVYLPHMIIGWVMLAVKLQPSRRQVIALLGYTVFILGTLEVSVLLDVKLEWIALQWVVALFVAWLINRTFI